MTETGQPARQVPLDYRPQPRGEGPAWMRLDKFAELCVGLGWTACGSALLVCALGWMFFYLDPRNAPWRVFAAVVLVVNTLGIALCVAAFALKAAKDGLLLGVLVIAVLMGAVAYGGTYQLAVRGKAAAPRPRRAAPQFPPQAQDPGDPPPDPSADGPALPEAPPLLPQ